MIEAWGDFVHWLVSHVRARCVTSPWILIAQVVFDLEIARSYLRIPRMLRRVVAAAGGVDHVTGGTQIWGFARFIGACGVSHLFGVVVLFFPALDWPRVGWLAWTALISYQTARLLARTEATIAVALRDRQSLEARLNDGAP